MAMVQKRKFVDFEERPDALSALEPQASRLNTSETDLCPRCADIDLEHLPTTWVNGHLGSVLVARLGYHDGTWILANCVLCRLFATVRPGSSGFYDLYAFGGRGCKVKPYRHYGDDYQPAGHEDSISMAIVKARESVKAGKDLGFANKDEIYKSIRETGLISLQNVSDYTTPTQFRGRLLDDNLANLKLVVDWLQLCTRNHRGRCGMKARQSLPSIQVIDCKSRCIVSVGHGVSYLALSYVWGSDLSVCQQFGDGSHMPEDVPQVVEDALKVTLRLKHRYLWIDRYCIPQDDADKRHAQIKHMGSIYTNAEATIVAAAGADSSFGLPGAGHRKRRPQARARVGNVLLYSTLPDPKLVIARSKWMTRAWTYQEGVLSRRLIIFTEDQVYFQCHGMHCYEAVVSPIVALHNKNKTGFRSRAYQQIYPKSSSTANLSDFLEALWEYSARDLTYDRDILDAILGVLRLFESARYPIYHLYGVPVSGMLKQYEGGPAPSAHTFGKSLLWNLQKPTSRRRGFPSWSWTGWKGRLVEMTSPACSCIFKYTAVAVAAQSLSDGRVLHWTSLLWRLSSKDETLRISPIITLEVWTLKIRFTYYRQNDEEVSSSGFFALFDVGPSYPGMSSLTEDSHLCCPLSLTQETQEGDPLRKKLLTEDFEGLILGCSGKEILVVCCFDGVFERIGMMCLYDIYVVPKKVQLPSNSAMWHRYRNPGIDLSELEKQWQTIRLG